MANLLQNILKIDITNVNRISLFLTFMAIHTSCHIESNNLDILDLKLFIQDLSSPSYRGRESGSQDSKRVAFYIGDRYKRAGLYPAFLEHARQLSVEFEKRKKKNSEYISKKSNTKLPPKKTHQASKKSALLHNSHIKNYLQAFSFKAGLFVSKNNYIKLNFENVSFLKQKVRPLPFTKPGSVSGTLIFAGFCLSKKSDVKKEEWNDFANIDIKDKILLCLRHGPGGAKDTTYRNQISFQAKWKNLSKLGAKGVIFLGREGFVLPKASNFRVSTKEGAIAVLADHHAFFQKFPFLGVEYKKLLEGKQSKLIGKSLGDVFLHTMFQAQKRIGFNVGAYLKKPEPNQRLLILGAHLDHLGFGYFSSLGTQGMMHQGADDNASGTAGVIELAMYFHKIKKILPKNTNILFLHFDAEERGLIGSRHFISSHYYSKPEVMINLDMIGRLRKSRGLSLQGCHTADPRWEQILSKSFAKNLGGQSFSFLSKGDTGQSIPCSEIVGQNGMGLRFVKGGSGPSDHSGFYRDDSSIAFFFTGSHRQYHTQNDKSKLINYPGLYKILLMIKDIVLGWAELEKPLIFQKALGKAARSDFEFKLRLGIIPGYGHDEQGLVVEAVKKDAPVFKTGLKKDDIIIQLGEHKINNINDLTEFLSNAASGRKYVLNYKRNGKVYSVQTELMTK